MSYIGGLFGSGLTGGLSAQQGLQNSLQQQAAYGAFTQQTQQAIKQGYQNINNAIGQGLFYGQQIIDDNALRLYNEKVLINDFTKQCADALTKENK